MVHFRFPHDSDTLLPNAVLDELFYMEIYRLNFLVAQYEQMSPGQRAAFVAVADHLKAEHNHGVLLGGYYCEPEHYECRDVSVEISRPQEEFFRLLIGAPGDEQNAQWFSFPCHFEQIWEYADRLGMDSTDLECYEMHSAIPRVMLERTEDMQDLNEVAWKLHALSPEAVVKVKAIMEAADTFGIGGLRSAIRTMDEYQFDPVEDQSHYGLRYLRANLPEGFDVSALSGVDLYDLDMTILSAKKGRMTEYGAIIRGEELYTMLPKPKWMQAAAESEEETEDCDPKWGDMT